MRTFFFPATCGNGSTLALYDKEAIYGADRFNVTGWDGYQKLMAAGWARGFEYHHFLTYAFSLRRDWQPAHLQRRARMAADWRPANFAFAYGVVGNLPDPAAIQPGRIRAPMMTCNMGFGGIGTSEFPRPEFLVAHLVTEDSGYGKNWKGRVTSRFGPKSSSKQPPEIAIRARWRTSWKGEFERSAIDPG